MGSLRTATAPSVTPLWNSPSAPAPRGRSARLSFDGLPQRIFQVLDGREMTAAERSWRMEIYAIVDDGETRWIQLALQGLERHELMISAPRSSDARQIASAVRSWVNELAPASVLNVA